MYRLIPALLLLLLGSLLGAQNTQIPFTPATERISSWEQRKALQANSIAKDLSFRNVGPSVQSGRVTDVAVSPRDPSHFYVAYASGGLWETTNNGTSFHPLFDQEMVMTIGAVAVNWETNTIWLGTGEVNSSRSSYAGAGVFRSDDGGKTWQHLGLGESHHIGRIVLHPGNANVAWVAVLGHLYSPNQERGVYKTTDGGKTWQRTLFVDGDTGAVDMAMDPLNPNILYASTWQRERRAWNFEEAGAGSGIYKSTDGGATWARLNSKESGFPTGEGVGRIGLAVSKAQGQTVLYAALDNYFRQPAKPDAQEEGLTKAQLRGMSKADFLKLETYRLADYLRGNGFAAKYTPEKVKAMVQRDEIKPAALVEYTEDANSLLFDTEVTGLEVYRSDDGGATWKKTHSEPLDDVYYTYGYYFGQVRTHPSNPDKVYVYGVPILRSDDAGKTWKNINGPNVHVDHHALWVNPSRPGHLILGNDGGINISYDDGEHWLKCNTPPVGQFYTVAVDMAKPYRVYGGLQDNGVWMGPSTYKASTEWHNTGQYPYQELIGGDGMQVAVDTRDNETVYTGYQFGNYFRMNTRTKASRYITPKHELGERPLRWNWQTPVQLSTHNPDIVYMGANKLYRSFNQGDDFTAISGDLTRGGRKGDVAFGTLTALHESPLRFGLLYTGSDDGLVYLSRDGGHTWANISTGLPEDLWVVGVQASSFVEGRVYVALNGYRWDDFRSLVFVSDDYGSTWQRIGQDLPLEPVNVIREDTDNADLLYVGTDHGLYASLDRGQSFMALSGGLPAVSVHALVVHPREKDLIVGTHGRSIFIGSVKELQLLTPEVREAVLHVFAAPSIKHSGRWGSKGWWGENVPEIHLPIYAQAAGEASLTVRAGDKIVLYQGKRTVQKGLNYLPYDLAFDSKQATAYTAWLNKDNKPDARPARLKEAENGRWYLAKGTYTVTITAGGVSKEVKLTVE